MGLGLGLRLGFGARGRVRGGYHEDLLRLRVGVGVRVGVWVRDGVWVRVGIRG